MDALHKDPMNDKLKEAWASLDRAYSEIGDAMTAIKEAEQPLTATQVIAMREDYFARRFTPHRKPLTDVTLWEMWVDSPSDVLRFARAIEQAHGIKSK